MLGGVLIVIYLMCTGRRLPRGRPAWIRIFVMGLLAAVCQGCYFAAAGLSSVSTAVLITIGTTPVLVLVAERVRGRQARDRRLIGAISLALPGLGLLLGGPGSVHLAGAGLALAAAAAFATITLVGAQPQMWGMAGGSDESSVDDLAVVGFGFILGGLLLSALVGPALSFRPNATSVGLLILLGAVPTGLAYGLYFRDCAWLGQVWPRSSRCWSRCPARSSPPHCSATALDPSESPAA
jgi:drug/metabolite transporter, DME family